MPRLPYETLAVIRGSWKHQDDAACLTIEGKVLATVYCRKNLIYRNATRIA